ncbi:hypothetical protein E8E13_001440 [Curvularia kusanoi]|uniref:Uncharacterized protein n=1 Tax=Curvularia kusanoi TaxID=90978 RepID=A0A9P4W7Z5_CURKU|nr:hypothetical protein E8E13_001440 [Curvularia kusanoi]
MADPSNLMRQLGLPLTFSTSRDTFQGCGGLPRNHDAFTINVMNPPQEDDGAQLSRNDDFMKFQSSYPLEQGAGHASDDDDSIMGAVDEDDEIAALRHATAALTTMPTAPAPPHVESVVQRLYKFHSRSLRVIECGKELDRITSKIDTLLNAGTNYDSNNERRRFASRLVELGEEKEAVRAILQMLLRSLDSSKRKMEKKQVAQEKQGEKKKKRTARRQATRAVEQAATGVSQVGVGLSQAGMGLTQAGRELSQAAKRPPRWTAQQKRTGRGRSQAGGPSPERYLKTSTSESMAIVKVEQDTHSAAPEATEDNKRIYSPAKILYLWQINQALREDMKAVFSASSPLHNVTSTDDLQKLKKSTLGWKLDCICLDLFYPTAAWQLRQMALARSQRLMIWEYSWAGTLLLLPRRMKQIWLDITPAPAEKRKQHPLLLNVFLHKNKIGDRLFRYCGENIAKLARVIVGWRHGPEVILTGTLSEKSLVHVKRLEEMVGRKLKFSGKVVRGVDARFARIEEGLQQVTSRKNMWPGKKRGDKHPLSWLRDFSWRRATRESFAILVHEDQGQKVTLLDDVLNIARYKNRILFIHLKVQIPVILAPRVEALSTLSTATPTVHVFLNTENVLASATKHRAFIPSTLGPDTRLVSLTCIVAADAGVVLLATEVLDGDDV